MRQTGMCMKGTNMTETSTDSPAQQSSFRYGTTPPRLLLIYTGHPQARLGPAFPAPLPLAPDGCRSAPSPLGRDPR